MGMGFHPAIKPFLPVNHPNGCHSPFLPEQVDVPVYRGQGKVGDIRFEMIVYPLGAGMGAGGPDYCQDCVPFFAMLSVGPR
jgi:hypothetical protein